MFKKKMSVKERIDYHEFKRNNAPGLLSYRPDLNVNDVRLSAMYHHYCAQKAKGNKKYFRKNQILYKWAMNYALRHEDKELFSIRKKNNNDFKI